MVNTRLQTRRRNTRLKKQFNLNNNQYQLMLEQQDHCCFICNEKEGVEGRVLSVDHDHATGKIRGLLCTNCNTALGKFKDNIDYLKKAIKYLQRNYTVPSVGETIYFIPHEERPNWKRIIKTPDGLFCSNISAARYYNVSEATMLSWLGMNKSKPHLRKKEFTSEKVYMSMKEIKEKYNVKD